MHRDIIISVIIHVMVITALWASGQFINGHTINPEDVMKVSLVSLPELAPSPPTSAPPMVKSSEPPVTVPNAKAKSIATKPKTKPKEKPKARRDISPKEEAEQVAAEEAQLEINQPAGSPFGGATVDNASFDYPYWFTQAFYKIQTNWHNPIDADGPLVCVVYFQVLKSGRVVEARVDRTSGIPAFDQACVTAVDRSSPFPPFPKEFGDEILGITIPFKYQP